mmetsp:Transcript_23677/g.49975  ORF Transcript_23677/g.49975 Transcript_23677/m.49975 type:complete len:91 (-) Transcript_23677:60-332(-)
MKRLEVGGKIDKDSQSAKFSAKAHIHNTCNRRPHSTDILQMITFSKVHTCPYSGNTHEKSTPSGFNFVLLFGEGVPPIENDGDREISRGR